MPWNKADIVIDVESGPTFDLTRAREFVANIVAISVINLVFCSEAGSSNAFSSVLAVLISLKSPE